MIIEGIHDLLAADGTLTALLSTYEFTSGVSAPAIFSLGRIPEDGTFPCITLREVSGSRWGTRCKRGYIPVVTVDCYVNKTNSLAVARQIAARVISLLDRTSSLSVSGFDAIVVRAYPAVQIADLMSYPGMRVRANVQIIET